MAIDRDGLREDELAHIEATHGFQFPPDLRTFLRDRPAISQWDRSILTVRLAELEAGEPLLAEDQVLPSEDERWGWMDWRNPAEIERALAQPFEDVASCFTDTEYWLPQWGARPAALDERLRFLSNAPVLIPLGGQHYMAAEPCEIGNPVFSIFCGIDIIIAGCDLADYLAGGPRSVAEKGAAPHIRFWSDIVYTR